jgi:type IV secretion system protein VirB4
MSKSAAPITELHQEYALCDDFCLTKKGTLIGAIELDGRDPDGLSADDYTALALISRSIYQNLPESVRCTTQYYLHVEGLSVELKSRRNPISNYLSQSRQRFLNARTLTSARIVHFFEIDPDENLTDIGLWTLFKHLLLAAKDKYSRTILRRYLSNQETIMAFAQNLERQRRELRELLLDVQARWDSIFSARILDKQQLWACCRFLANLDPDLLAAAASEPVPADQWDVLLAEGDRCPVTIGNHDFLKFKNVDNTYARMLSVTRYGENTVTPALWSAKTHSPGRQTGNYILMTRFAPFSRIRQALLFGTKKRELKRKNMSVGDVFQLFGNQAQTGGDRYARLKPAIKEKMIELERAEGLEERWGHSQAAALVFGKTPAQVNATARNLRKSMLQSSLSLVAESVNLSEAYRAFLPAGGHCSVRNMDMNCTQFGAASLIYRSSEGQVTVRDLDGEEAQYMFTCPDGTLFHFSPFVEGKAIVIGVGPIRTGKSFTKNTIAAHFAKYKGFYRAIDIDPGSETLAQFFRHDGAIFRIGHGSRGFNSFAVASGPEDNFFIVHQKRLVIEMLKSNDNDNLQRLEMHEQQQLDQAIVSTLKLPPALRRFSTMVNHCPRELQQKLARWYGSGMFAPLFDQQHDAIGALTKPVAAFNLAGVKDNAVCLPLAMAEITYRVTRMFEDPDFRSLPKYLDIDEAHALLKIGYMRDYIIEKTRTWGKWMAGIGLWSQDPHEFLHIEDWSALRSAASTLFFMADPTADADLYKQTFGLTDGEIEAIRRLRPKRQAYIIQRDIGVSKTILVEVEPEQHVISTSRPEEAVMRERLINEHGIEEGIKRTVEALNLNPIERAA